MVCRSAARRKKTWEIGKGLNSFQISNHLDSVGRTGTACSPMYRPQVVSRLAATQMLHGVHQCRVNLGWTLVMPTHIRFRLRSLLAAVRFVQPPKVAPRIFHSCKPEAVVERTYFGDDLGACLLGLIENGLSVLNIHLNKVSDFCGSQREREANWQLFSLRASHHTRRLVRSQ